MARASLEAEAGRAQGDKTDEATADNRHQPPANEATIHIPPTNHQGGVRENGHKNKKEKAMQ